MLHVLPNLLMHAWQCAVVEESGLDVWQWACYLFLVVFRNALR